MRSVAGFLFVMGGVLTLSLLTLAWPLGHSPSQAQDGTMHNCPHAGRWAISVWSGDDDTDTGQALATCGAGVVDFAYSLDPATNSWQSYFEGLAQISTMPAVDNLQGVITHGAVGALAPTPTPPTTATPAATPTLTPSTSEQLIQPTALA